MNAMQVDEMATVILEQVVPASTLTEGDGAVIERHREYLLGLEDGLVAEFYDTLFAHAPTAAVFEDGERAAREQTLRDWWRRTIGATLDDTYWHWMALVGIVHIRRGVRNPMMSSIVTVVGNFVHQRALADLPPEEAEALRVAFSHLASTVVSVISEAYTMSYVGALENLAGLDPKLTERMLAIEVKSLEANGREKIA
jgi:hypothetical protein